MSVSDTQYQRLLSRLTALEELVNDLITAHQRFITLTQVNQLLTITQTSIQDINETIEALDNRVTAIEEEPIS